MEPSDLQDNDLKGFRILPKETTMDPKDKDDGNEFHKADSSLIIESDKLIDDAEDLVDESPSPDLKENNSSSLQFQKERSQQNIHIDHFSNQFWRKATSWKKRKKIALKLLKNYSNYLNPTLHYLAYHGKLEDIKPLDEDEKSKLFGDETPKDPNETEVKVKKKKILAKDRLGLTPLIYAIWGENDREDESKSTSKWLLEWSLENYKQKMGNDYIKMENSGLFFDPALKNELGHAKVHKIIPIPNFQVYHLILEDYHESLAYWIEAKGFKLKDKKFDHSVCDKDRPISIAAFALRVKSIQCANLLFDNIMKNIEIQEYSYMLRIIQSELSDYLSFNSVIIEDLLKGFTNIQEKSLPVNIDKIPILQMSYTTSDNVENYAYNHFDDMPDAKDFIKAQIINSKIKLPNISGSEKSLSLIQKLASTENLMLFRVTLIKSYLQCKWDKMWPLIFFQSLLIWVNIPIVVLLVFVFKYNLGLIISFLVINSILSTFELFQFASMSLHQYFGNVDQIYAFLGLRLLLLGFLFYPNFQPYTCTLYLFATSCVAAAGLPKRYILLILFTYSVVVGLIFPGFWIGWEYTKYLTIAAGSVFFILACLANFISLHFVANFVLRNMEMGLIVSLLFMSERNFGIMILIQFFTGIIFITQARLLKPRRLIFKMVLDLLKVGAFSVNFYTTGQLAFFITNSFVLAISFTNFVHSLIDYYELKAQKQLLFTVNSFFIMILIGFDLDDSLRLKIFIICSELAFLYYYKRNKLINFSSIASNLISMLFSWNSIDLVRISLCIVWLMYEFLQTPDKALTYALVSLILVRGLTGFRCFKMTRYYVRLILNSIHDIIPFIIIFFYSTFSFGIICSIYRNITMSEIWMYPYDLNIGSASHENSFDMNYISFFVATVINVIIMLNLLISILGDSFDRFQVSAPEIDFLEMAQALAEFETMLFWRRNMYDSGAYLIGILNESKSKKRQGKITRDEFFELKDVVAGIRDGLDKQFELTEKKMLNEVTTNEDRVKDEIMQIKVQIERNVQMRILQSERRIMAALARIKKIG